MLDSQGMQGVVAAASGKDRPQAPPSLLAAACCAASNHLPSHRSAPVALTSTSSTPCTSPSTAPTASADATADSAVLMMPDRKSCRTGRQDAGALWQPFGHHCPLLR